MVTAKGVEALEAAMDRHVDDRFLQKMARKALRSLGQGHPVHCIGNANAPGFNSPGKDAVQLVYNARTSRLERKQRETYN